jgi:membrane protease YdiL (CAAX protease family)
MKTEIKSIWKLLLLHLFPGFILFLIYVFLLNIGFLKDYPKLIVLGVGAMFSIIPLELGYLFYVAKKETGTYNIFKILGLKSNLKFINYVIWVVILFVAVGLLFTLVNPLTDLIKKAYFTVVPSEYDFVQDMSQFSKPLIILSIAMSFFIFTLIAPIIEELYFRGFLLSRMKWMGACGVFLNVFLFSLYHFWSPWQIVVRTIALFPLFYVVYKKDSLKLGIFVHCLVNFMDAIALMALLF